MTYTGIKSDGSHDDPETLVIAIDPVRDMLFLVTWQEGDKTTVVHLEDYRENRILPRLMAAFASSMAR